MPALAALFTRKPAKPRLRKNLPTPWGNTYWTCKADGTLAGGGATPRSAYLEWRFINGVR